MDTKAVCVLQKYKKSGPHLLKYEKTGECHKLNKTTVIGKSHSQTTTIKKPYNHKLAFQLPVMNTEKTLIFINSSRESHKSKTVIRNICPIIPTLLRNSRLYAEQFVSTNLQRIDF